MIHYQIDFTDDEYRTLEGDAEDFAALRQTLTEGASLPDCMGYLRTDAAPDASLCIAAVKEYGVSLSVEAPEGSFLALADRERLHETVDVWGDGILVSEGLFLPEALAWEGISAFAEKGVCSEALRWITPEEIPEDGNFII